MNPQKEAAQKELDGLFSSRRNSRAGLSEGFLRMSAAKRWVAKDEPLQAEILLAEAEARVVAGKLKKFNRGQTTFYKPSITGKGRI